MLLGTSLWGIGAARRATRLSVSVAKLRQHAAVFVAYSNDYRGMWPYFVRPDIDGQSIVYSGGVYTSQEYFEAVNGGWRYAMADGYYSGIPQSDMFLDQANPSQAIPFVYSCAFGAAPDYWNVMTRTGRQQWRSTRVDEVQQPGKKSILLGFGLMGAAPSGGRASAAFCDGHAAETKASEYLSGITSGDGVGSMWHSFDLWVGLHTLSGVKGTDIP